MQSLISFTFNDPPAVLGNPWGSSYSYGLILIPASIHTHMIGKVWDEIIYPFQNVDVLWGILRTI